VDRLRAMGVFVAVADASSLSGAARQLDEPLTNVSRLLSQLEEHLGLTLVDRTTRRMVLTAAGRTYLKTCRRILEDLENAETVVSGLSNPLSGDLSITAPVGLGRLHVLPVVTEFLVAYPGINVRLLLVDRVVDLISEDIDLAVRVGELRDSDLLTTRIGSLRLIACAAPHYLKQNGMPQSVAALAGHDCITFAELPGGSRWVFKSKKFGRHAARVRARLSVNTADSAVTAAIAGAGIARVLSYQVKAAFDAALLEPVLQRFEDGAIPVNFVYRPTRSEKSRVREFVRFATGRLRNQLVSK
jgi:DNA-binding transcriptional LysR family regulator